MRQTGSQQKSSHQKVEGKLEGTSSQDSGKQGQGSQHAEHRGMWVVSGAAEHPGEPLSSPLAPA